MNTQTASTYIAFLFKLFLIILWLYTTMKISIFCFKPGMRPQLAEGAVGQLWALAKPQS